MEGRRVNSRSQKINPLFTLFLCMIAALIVLLIVSVVLGVKLGKVNKSLKNAQTQVTELEKTVTQLEEDLKAARSRVNSSVVRDVEPATSDEEEEVSASWLDLSGHSEVTVKPTALLDGYKTCYTTAGVNLRGGPGTNYARIDVVDYGAAVQVAARENGWSFVKVGGKFGWISSDYLSTTQPPAIQRVEGTSGSLLTH